MYITTFRLGAVPAMKAASLAESQTSPAFAVTAASVAISRPPRTSITDHSAVNELIRCAGCHNEHRAFRGDLLCTDCHRSIAETAPNAGLRNARCFPDGHPQFRVTLVSDAVKSSVERVDLGSDPKPTDRPNLVFSHAAHLVPEGFAVLGYKPDGMRRLPRAGAGRPGLSRDHLQGPMQRLPWAEVRYRAAMAGSAARRRHRNGSRGRGFLRDHRAQGWNRGIARAETRSPRCAGSLGGAEDECSAHDDFRAEDENSDRLLLLPCPRQCRRSVPCRAGHSQASSDVLVPGIERCATCHGTETASFQVRSTCASCHDFHRPEFGPL